MTPPISKHRSPEEIARGIAEFYLQADCSCEPIRACKVCQLTEDIVQALREGVEAEREACAKVADKEYSWCLNNAEQQEKMCRMNTSMDIAKAIRSRSTTEGEDL